MQVLLNLLSIDLSWLWPLMIFFGVVMFLARRGSVAGPFGRPIA